MYKQPIDNDRLPSEEVFERCAKFNREHAPINSPRINTNNPRYKGVHSKVQTAIKNGTLIPEPCTICGSAINIHAHHPDYSKPLDVNWLCSKCHKELHAHIRNPISI